MTKCQQALHVLMALMILFVVGCSSLAEKVQLTSSPSIVNTDKVFTMETPFITPFPLLSSTPSPMFKSDKKCIPPIFCTGSPEPTMRASTQKTFFMLVKDNGNCDLPCFLGIVPGQTMWVDAESILKPYVVNNPISYDKTRSTQINRTYSTQIRTKANKDIPVEMVMSLAIDVGQKDVVQHIAIRVELYGDGFTEFHDKHLSRYGLREIFLRNGIPSAVYFQPEQSEKGYGFNVIYDELKMVIVFAGNAKQNSGGGYTVCPNIGDGDVSSMMIVLASPFDPMDVKKLMGYPIENNPALEKVTGLSLNDFYHLMIGDQQPACFAVK